MQIFDNTVKLRGFLGEDAKVPNDHIFSDSFVVLRLATVSGTWDLSTNEWTSCTDWHRIVCVGRYFCGFLRGMRRGDYLEVEGELHDQDEIRATVVAGESHPVIKTHYAVHATRIQRLDRPTVLLDMGDGD
jgi:hypothetical protein